LREQSNPIGGKTKKTSVTAKLSKWRKRGQELLFVVQKRQRGDLTVKARIGPGIGNKRKKKERRGKEAQSLS